MDSLNKTNMLRIIDIIVLHMLTVQVQNLKSYRMCSLARLAVGNSRGESWQFVVRKIELLEGKILID